MLNYSNFIQFTKQTFLSSHFDLSTRVKYPNANELKFFIHLLASKRALDGVILAVMFVSVLPLKINKVIMVLLGLIGNLCSFCFNKLYMRNLTLKKFKKKSVKPTTLKILDEIVEKFKTIFLTESYVSFKLQCIFYIWNKIKYAKK